MKEKFIKIEKALTKIPEKAIQLYTDLKKEILESREKLKDIGSTNYNLGLYHLDNQNIRDAILRFKIAMHFNKNFAYIYYNLARCYIFNEKHDKARLELEKAIAIDDTLVEAHYRLSLIDRNYKNMSIPLQVVKEDFNLKAKTYEAEMIINLGYTAPHQLATKIVELLKEKKHSLEKLTCLDLGCGTGILGSMLRDTVALETLVGVDISPNMLELAKSLENNGTSTYDQVSEMDLHKLELGSSKFDIIVSCLGLDYSNEVDKIFDRLEGLTGKNTIFAIVSFKSFQEETAYDNNLKSYSHNDLFWEKLFKKYRWHVEQQEEINVFNSGAKASLYLLTKK